MVIIGLAGILASSQIPDNPPEITMMQYIPKGLINVSNNGKSVMILVDVIDPNDPTNHICPKANSLVNRLIYKPPIFKYRFSVKHPGENSYNLYQYQETRKKSFNCEWWVYPRDAGLNYILINVTVKGNGTSKVDPYIVINESIAGNTNELCLG